MAQNCTEKSRYFLDVLFLFYIVVKNMGADRTDWVLTFRPIRANPRSVEMTMTSIEAARKGELANLPAELVFPKRESIGVAIINGPISCKPLFGKGKVCVGRLRHI